MRDDGEQGFATGETLGADDPSLDRTLGASEASLQPRTERIRPPATITDYDELVIVDPAHYAVRGELARGGMGRILEAHDRRLGRKVAIKEVIHHDETALGRFEREARITARLEHPGIVHVHEAGRWPTGQPFYAMKLIRGQPFDKVIAGAKTLRERLALLPNAIAVVDALAYAHNERVIHRDLKPSNVLVGDFGETVVIDWGLAKDLGAAEHDDISVGPYRRAGKSSSDTVAGSIVGTPAYMPPEQARGKPLDPRADVYSLGAMLYQLLAGVPPYTGRTTEELLEKVLDASPRALAMVEPDAPTDLVAIVEKAMARDPEQRFANAGEMAAELKRFQTGQLVTTHHYTRWELVRRFVRRYRAAVTVGAVAFLTLAVVGIASLVKIVKERDRADIAAHVARLRADEGTLARARAALDTDPAQSLALLEQLSPGASEWRGARMIASDAASRGTSIAFGRDKPIWYFALDRDGKQLAAVEEGGGVRIWDLATLTDKLRQFPVGVLDVVFVGDALFAIDDEGVVWRWPADAAQPIKVRKLSSRSEADVALARLSPDGTRVLLIGKMRRTWLVDLATGAPTEIGKYGQAQWAADGKSLYLYDRDQAGRLDRYDLATGQATVLQDDAQAMAFASDGRHTWLGGVHGELRELATRRTVKLDGPVTMIAILPDGSAVSISEVAGAAAQTRSLEGRRKGMFMTIDPSQVATSDFALIVSDGTPAGNQRLLGHAAQVHALAVTPDGRIISGDRNGQIRIWRRQPVARDHGDGHTTTSRAMLTADRRELVLTRLGPALEVRELATGRSRIVRVTRYPAGMPVPPANDVLRLQRIGRSDHVVDEHVVGPDAEVRVLVGSANGRRWLTLDERHQVAFFDLDRGTGRVIMLDAAQIALNPNGTLAAIGLEDRRLVLFDLEDDMVNQIGHSVETTAMAFSSANDLAVATLVGTLYVYRGSRATVFEQGEDVYRALAFSPDGSILVGGGDQWRVRSWNVATHGARDLGEHAGTVTAIVFGGPDRVATVGADLTVRVWPTSGGSPQVLRGHTDFINSVVFDEDDHVVTGAVDHTARLWDLRSGLSRTLAGHEDEILYAGHIAGMQRVLVVDRFHQIAEYPDALPRDELSLRGWIAAARRGR
ncbi:MAG TPA: protein kinase [Kofleriaceae bacterium]|nr:protein kinase [Kofleriaceae bacterium]